MKTLFLILAMGLAVGAAYSLAAWCFAPERACLAGHRILLWEAQR